MSNSFWFSGPEPKTKFAPKFKIPLYLATDGSSDFVQRMINYILKVEEDIIVKEGLVSEVPKNNIDPYKHTQQWKQHNLLDDIAGLGGEHLERFPKDPVIEELFNLVRINYLTHLANLRYPRRKAYIHGWANVIRQDEWISQHYHMTHDEAYLSCVYYLTTNNTNLYLINVEAPDVMWNLKTEARKILFFPSWIPHFSDKAGVDDLRISIAFDIVTEKTAEGNPWRPHRLLDDPDTMPGIDRR